MSLIEANQLTLKLNENKTILNRISLKIQKGEYVILIGANGGGKSSLIKCIKGGYLPTSGSLLLDGLNPKDKQCHKSICTLTQNAEDSLFLDLTIYENMVCASNIKKERKEIKKYLHDFSEYLSLNLDQRVSGLSGGQKQVLALAMCLSRRPTLFLLDEHTSALDPQKANEIMELVKKYKSKNPELTIIMTTHNLEDAVRYGTRILAMKQGEIVADIEKDSSKTLKRESLLSFY